MYTSTRKNTFTLVSLPSFSISGVKPRPNDRNIIHRQHNISQHCWTQHVACVWPPCCDMLAVVGSSFKLVKFEPTTPNMSQHVATSRNKVAKRTQHVAPNKVAICCVGMLRSFGRGLISAEKTQGEN